MITIKSKKDIEKMRAVCKIVAQMYDYIEHYIKPGMSTYDIDKKAKDFIISHGGNPAQIGYDPHISGVMPFPYATCISVNDCIIHGIPNKRCFIEEGDIVSIDTVIEKNGFNGDAARTFIVGKPKNKLDEQLVQVTKNAFFEGIKFAKPRFRIGDISNAIERYVKSYGFDVIHEFQGHGIGRSMHEDPGIPNYGKPGKGPRIEENMTLAIEPMVCQGSRQIYENDDGWSIFMDDGKNSAHYENTVLITKNRPEVLTLL